MKISVFETDEWEQASFERLGRDHELRFEGEPLTPQLADKHADADVVSVFISSTVDADVLDAFSSLQLIATRSTGFDHIDVGWCGERDVAVANVPSYGSNTVAEHVFALLLALSHHVVDAADRTRRGDFSRAGLQGFDLQGRTMGVVGTGDIGQHTIRIARGFGMDVLGYDVAPDEELASELGFHYVNLDELLQNADVVSLHVPGGKATRHLLGEQELRSMKPGSVLINTSRGSVVDADALAMALADGPIAAAGLDVIEEEPVVREEAELLHAVYRRDHDLETLLSNHILLRMRNVLITPHTAFDTKEAVQRILDTTADNIEAFIDGRPRNLVT